MGALGEHWLSVNGLSLPLRVLRGAGWFLAGEPCSAAGAGRFTGFVRRWQDRAMDLSAELGDWTDWDCAAFLVGRALAIFPASAKFLQVKGMFWTENPLGDALHEVLALLSAAGVLERRDVPDEQFRWSRG
jgi:hypothetical protein